MQTSYSVAAILSGIAKFYMFKTWKVQSINVSFFKLLKA